MKGPVAPAVVDVPSAQDRPVALTLDRADAAEVLAVMEPMSGQPVLVDASALGSLKCAAITIDEHGLTGARAASALADKLRAQGFRVDHTANEWRVSIDPDAPPKCPGVAPVAAAPVDPTPEIVSHIREIGPNDHAITRQALDSLLEHQKEVFQSTRILPELENGKTVGVRVFGVRPDTVLGRLGFENGDRLERVMGKPLSSAEEALEAYSNARNASLVDIGVNRRGQPVKLVIRVE